MGEKTAGVGHFTIPTAPAIGTVVAQNASANTYTAAYVQLSSAAPAAIFITGLYVQLAAGASIPTYMSVQLATGVAASEVVVGQHNMQFGPTSGVAATAWGVYKPIYPPIAVANGIRIAAKTASSVASGLSWAVTMECINQANIVDDGVAVGSVSGAVGSVTGAVGSVTGAVGSVTGNVGGSVASVTAAVTLPSIPANWITAAGITAASLNGKGDWNIGKTGYALSAAGVQAIWDALTSALTTVGSIGKLLVTNIDALISGRMATYTQPTGFLAATFPTGTVSNTTNITAGTITTTTNTTNAPTAGDFTAAMKTSLNAATPAATVSDKTGFSLTAAYDAAKTAAQAGNSMTLTAAYDAAKTAAQAGNAMTLTVAYDAAKTSAPASDVTAIKAKTDSLAFTVAGKVDSNVKSVNDTTIAGAGTAGAPWGP